MCAPKSQAMLWAMQLIHPAVWILFGITMLNFYSDHHNLYNQCDTDANIVSQDDSNCPTQYSWSYSSDYDESCACASFGNQDGYYWEATCEVALNSTRCNGYDEWTGASTYTCSCNTTIYLDTVVEVLGWMLLADFAFFELIKLLIVWRLWCIISAMRSQPKGYINAGCLKCGIKSLGNSCWLRCIMCNPAGKSLVLYMYHRGMLLKNCGCCCLFFWQTMAGGALIFFYLYAWSFDLFYDSGLGSKGLWWMTLIVDSIWILIQMGYCVSPPYSNDEKVKEELVKYNLPFLSFSSDLTGKVVQPTAQAIPLSIQQPTQTVMVPQAQVQQQPQVLYVVQQQPQPPPQQTVVVVPQPTPAMSVASHSSIGPYAPSAHGSVRNLHTNAGGATDYQLVSPSAPGPVTVASAPSAPGMDDPIASAPPPMNPELNAPPPAYNDYLAEVEENGEGGGGGYGNGGYPNLGEGGAETHQ